MGRVPSGPKINRVGFRLAACRCRGMEGSQAKACATRLARMLLVMAAAWPLHALNPALSINQYLHTSWTQEEGSPLPPVQDLAQAKHGYLWLNTVSSLIRFDGMRFTEWAPTAGPGLSQRINCLRPSARGGMWLGTREGVCRVDAGRVIRYPALAAVAGCQATSLTEDPQGGLWVLSACPQAPFRLARMSADGRVQNFGTRDGVPEDAQIFFADSAGKFWVGTESSLCRWSPGSQKVCTGAPMNVLAIAEAKDGRLAVVDGRTRQVFWVSEGKVTAAGPRLPDVTFSPRAILCDRDSNIWIGTLGQGLLRVQGNRVDRLSRSDGLSSNLVMSLAEDQEGDIWVGTARGIDRVRDPKVQFYSTLNGLSGDFIAAVYGAADGSVWAGTGGGLDRIEGGRVSNHHVEPGVRRAVLSLYEDERQRLWVGTLSGLAVQSGGHFTEILTSRGEHLDRVFNISSDHQGAVWAADTGKGLFTIHGGTAKPVDLPANETADLFRLMVDSHGAAWLGHYKGGITVVNGSSLTHYGTNDGVAAGPVLSLYEDGKGMVWAGTGTGLSRFAEGRWTTWTAAQGLPEGGVQSIIEGADESLWLLTASGVARVSRGNLESSGKPLSYILYGRTEGLRLMSTGAMSTPRMTRSRDGRIWLCTEDGVAAIDPSRVITNPVKPPVAIEQVVADGKAVDPAAAGEAAFRGHELQITYTGLSLMVPERVRFRYRLYGLDGNWTDAGTRRNVAYVNLPPGHYRFQVIACNSDGVWNTAGAAVALRVDPYFYQTAWFFITCVTAGLLAVWGVYRLNVRRAVARVQLIAAERVRFSRELHDSLLQGFAGVVYLLEAAAKQFETAPEKSKLRLDKALDQADQSLREARQMIVNMRIPALENHTLPEALETAFAQVVSGLPVDFQFEVKGRARQAPHNVEANFFLIAREAVTNAVNHASAKRIRVELRYLRRELQLSIQDDGTGFDTAQALAKAGHWGFRGMQERARQLGGSFFVDSSAGNGARIEVSAPLKQ
jgi:signal transduction histidine kinase/ligand-binding sensor domain-containing protein